MCKLNQDYPRTQGLVNISFISFLVRVIGHVFFFFFCVFLFSPVVLYYERYCGLENEPDPPRTRDLRHTGRLTRTVTSSGYKTNHESSVTRRVPA